MYSTWLLLLFFSPFLFVTFSFLTCIFSFFLFFLIACHLIALNLEMLKEKLASLEMMGNIFNVFVIFFVNIFPLQMCVLFLCAGMR